MSGKRNIIMTVAARAKSTHNQSTADKVRALARAHGVAYVPGPNDAWARKVTELSGDDVRLDEVQNLILTLSRAKVVSKAEAVQLHIAYYHEK
jgi:hypothetical protein